MTALQTRPAPAARWETRAICDPDVDYAAVTDATHPDYARAKRACDHCPVQEECRTTALGARNLAGLAGGLLESQRAEWRRRRGVKVTSSTVDWMPAAVAAVESPNRVPDHVVALVRVLAAEGLTTEEIAAQTGLTAQKVKHSRQLAGGGRTRRPTS